MSINKIKIQLSWKIQELSKKESHRNELTTKIDAIERRRISASILEKDTFENQLTDLNESLNKIKEEIIRLNSEIEKFEKELENISTNSYSEEDYKYAEQYKSESSTEDKELTEADDLENHTDEKELSIPINLGDFGNVHSNYYQSRLEELRKLERVVEANSSHENDAPKKIQAIELIRTDDPIKKTILYVATFFPQLSNHDFERTVSFSLQWQSTTVTVPLIEISEEREQAKIISEKKNLSEIWQEEGIANSDKIMEECYLSSVSLKNYVRVIDFDFPYLRNDLKTYFKGRGSQYLEKQFKRSKLLLLDPSIGVARNAIELSVEMAKSNPPVYGGQWLADILRLFRLFTNFLQLEKIGFSSSEIAQLLFSDEERWEEFKSFAKFLSQVDEEYRGEFLISRVAFLIQKMLEYSNLKPEVEKFFHLEIATQNQETVLALISLLQSEPKFDWLPWTEKLLNEKSKLIGFYTRQILFYQLKQSKNNVYKILTIIKRWIPNRRLDKQSDYTQSQVYALRLIYKYSGELSDNLKVSDYGCYPPKYQLFASLDDNSDDKSTERKLRLLIEWAFDPSHEHFVRDSLNSASLLIAEWFSIICGLDDKEPDPRSLALADKLLEQVIAEVNPSQQRELIKYWNKQRNILLTEANKAQKARKKSQQNNLMQKRGSVRQLIERFIYLQQSS